MEEERTPEMFDVKLTADSIRKVVLELVPYPAQHPVTEDIEIAEKLQIKFEQGRLLTLSQDGTSAHASHMGRSGPITVNQLNMWCHTILLLDDWVVDLWAVTPIMQEKQYWEKITVDNWGRPLRVYDEDAFEEVTAEFEALK